MSDANLADAEVRGADFASTTSDGFTADQLYSTASYQTGDLRGIILDSNNLSGWNLAGQNLSEASFIISILTGTDLSHANLSHAHFGNNNLTDTNLSGADTRGALLLNPNFVINTNMIRPDGCIQGLDLTNMQSLAVRNYAGDPIRSLPSIPVRIEQHLTMDATGALHVLFEEKDWHLLISFEPGISVTLGGTLELDFVAGMDVASQIGRTIHIFDWTGVSLVGQFNIVSSYSWDLSQLYTTGEITLVPEPTPAALLTLTTGFVLVARRNRALRILRV